MYSELATRQAGFVSRVVSYTAANEPWNDRSIISRKIIVNPKRIPMTFFKTFRVKRLFVLFCASANKNAALKAQLKRALSQPIPFTTRLAI